MHIHKLQHEDKEYIRAILIETGVFKMEEIGVALELIDIFLEDPHQKDYEMYTCVNDNDERVGFLSLGPTPITNGTFDLYWIAVKPTAQRRGVGKCLLEFGEQLVRSNGGRLLVAETSSQPKYSKARTIYLHNGYTELAHIKDYYDVGDDLVIYGKYLRQ